MHCISLPTFAFYSLFAQSPQEFSALVAPREGVEAVRHEEVSTDLKILCNTMQTHTVNKTNMTLTNIYMMPELVDDGLSPDNFLYHLTKCDQKN